MKDKLAKAFYIALFGTGAGFGVAGGYMAAKSATQEFITHKAENDSAKQCIRNVKAGNACTAEQYQWLAMYGDSKKDYGMGLSWLFGGASFVRMSLSRLRKPAPKADDRKP